MNHKIVYVCSNCGSEDIRLKAWVDPNNDNKYIDDADDGECWCDNCEEYTDIDTKEI